MLSISNVSAIQASSYYEKDDYYARGDSEDRWQGKLKEELHLPDSLTKQQFDKLIREKEELAGFDLCFSAPKSVSVAMCLSDEVKLDMIQAHNEAVRKTLELIEEREIGTRFTQNGITEHIKTGNMIAGLFNHYVSRNSDPQLHTHSVILNKTMLNGKMYSIDNPDLYRNKILYGQIYRNFLAGHLLEMGYQTTLTNVEKGFFELEGIDKVALDNFSSRRIEIIEKLKEWNTDAAESASKAALTTRKAKEHKDMNVLTDSWRETIAEMGGIQLQKKEAAIITTSEQKEKAAMAALDMLGLRSFAFQQRELRKAILAAGVAVALTDAEGTALMRKIMSEKLVYLGKLGDQGEPYYTTQKNIAFEQEIFREVEMSQGTVSGIDSKKAAKVLDAALDRDGTGLSDQQRTAVMDITTSSDKYHAVQGLAGTGKTHMLNYTREVLESDGYKVLGACFTGKAAQGLQEDAKIDSVTIHSFLNKLEKEAGNRNHEEDMQKKTVWNLKGLVPGGQKEVWVVDEASMVDNNTLRYLVQAARIKQAKVILVGDKQQLLPVGVGNAFKVLTETNRIKASYLDEIRRQKDAHKMNSQLLQAVKESVLGTTEKSFEILEDDKQVQVIPKAKRRMAAIVKEFTQLSDADQKETVVLTAGNKDRRQLNQLIRDKLLKQGRLQPGKVFMTKDAEENTYKREFSVDDRIIFLQNDSKMGVRNGQVGYIKSVDERTLVVESSGKTITVDMKKYNKIDHGYVMTAHKAQGITVNRVLINMDSNQKMLNNRNAFYVDISRARYFARVFVDDKAKIQEQVKNFAKKLTSEDFLIANSKTPSRKPADEEKNLRKHIRRFKTVKNEQELKKEHDLKMGI